MPNSEYALISEVRLTTREYGICLRCQKLLTFLLYSYPQCVFLLFVAARVLLKHGDAVSSMDQSGLTAVSEFPIRFVKQ